MKKCITRGSGCGFAQCRPRVEVDGSMWNGPARRGAACVIATLQVAGRRHVVLVKQQRPPAGGVVLEFPAGLIDEGEGAAESALRELAEETGFRGDVREIGPPSYNTPGLSSETVVMARVDVQKHGQSCNQDGEAIEVVVLPVAGLLGNLREMEQQGVKMDAKVWCYAEGLAAQEPASKQADGITTDDTY
ncbi:MAG: NUDIX hydrolase [Bdellovibrionaceae bacterium]|nr:NUDIX hydrolase [Pseudobdellovibrionaceae bacterium]